MQKKKKKNAEKKRQFETILEEEKGKVRQESSQHLDYTVDKFNADKNNEVNEKLEGLEKSHKQLLLEELSRHYLTYKQELHDACMNLESELSTQYGTEMELRLNDEQDKHHTVVNNNLSCLIEVESKMTHFLNCTEEAIKKMQLWAAVHALNTSINHISDNGRTQILRPQILNVLQCNPNDKILVTIVATLPKCAIDFGVIPEHVLRQRFYDTKHVCKKAGSVRDELSLFSYAFSYIKSYFVIPWFYKRGYEDEIDVGNVSSYELLEKADYYIQQGDLEQAAKFMNQLKGVPQKLASDWIKEVILLLETKQSANLLMAYAGLLNVGFE